MSLAGIALAVVGILFGGVFLLHSFDHSQSEELRRGQRRLGVYFIIAAVVVLLIAITDT